MYNSTLAVSAAFDFADRPSIDQVLVEMKRLHLFEFEDQLDAGQPIAVFEAQKRDVAHLIKFALSPIAVLLMTPFIRPFNWTRMILTYVIPAIPLFTFWDGLVSVLRTYSVEELNDMTRSLDGGKSYCWEIGESKSGSVLILHLLGYPE